MTSTATATAAADQHAALGLDTAKKTSTHTRHPEAQWFPTAGLGLFVHMGLASVHGNLDLSWSMIANTPWDAAAKGANKVAPDEYWRLAERYQPMHYDPDRWLAAAAKAGFQYAVLTAMHHDGYTLWPSGHGDFGVHSHMGGRDLVRPFVDACRRHGLKVGLYLSPPDWHFDRKVMSFNYPTMSMNPLAPKPNQQGHACFDERHQPFTPPPRTPEHEAQRRALFHGRVEELLTRYGRIDLLWFDGGTHDNAVRDRARQLQPHIILNSRSCDGDFDCTECSLPTQRFAGWFETCHCWQASDIPLRSGQGMVDVWGYLKAEQYKSAAWLLESLIRLRQWGGNLLANVSPRPDGELPDVVYQRLAETAAWMQHSRESVLGTTAGPASDRCNVPVTTRGPATWYLHALPGFDGPMELNDVDAPREVQLLRTGEAIPFTWQQRRLSVTIPPAQRTGLPDVAVVRW